VRGSPQVIHKYTIYTSKYREGEKPLKKQLKKENAPDSCGVESGARFAQVSAYPGKPTPKGSALDNPGLKNITRRSEPG